MFPSSHMAITARWAFRKKRQAKKRILQDVTMRNLTALFVREGFFIMRCLLLYIGTQTKIKRLDLVSYQLDY